MLSAPATSHLKFLQPPLLAITFHKSFCCHHPVSHLSLPHPPDKFLAASTTHNHFPQNICCNHPALSVKTLFLLPLLSPSPPLLLCKACIAIDVGIMWGNRGTGGDFPVYDYLILLFVNDLSIDA